ncbi:AGAP002875-PA-like protein [Anopheles sinensis]|uniref:AGAP002875-PA-like protein n=1 Tax=Anopheles sinensis TaxID=74873 RepID=A0A084VK29_ANOSI|nr:AGAP002875-PA-like protein [Anopheles sinensis]
MSVESGMEHVENAHFSRQQSEIDLLSNPIAMVTASGCETTAVRDGRTIDSPNAAGKVAPAELVQAMAVANDEGAAGSNEDGRPLGSFSDMAARMDSNKTATTTGAQTELSRSLSSNQRNSDTPNSATGSKTSGTGGAGGGGGGKRKRRRGKSQRGKSSSNRPYSKTQWKYQKASGQSARAGLVVGTGCGSNKRRLEHHYALGARRKTPFLLSDQPPLVPYNTNRFLMEDHMPQVLTPSGRTRDSSFSIDSEENYFYSLPEDEEDFLTKEFSDVYEKARCEQLESLSHAELIQEYIKLAVDYEQVLRRNTYTASAISKAAVAGSSADGSGDIAGLVGYNGPPKCDDATYKESLLEDQVRELMAENIELRRQLDQAKRMGLVVCTKSSPSYCAPDRDVEVDDRDSVVDGDDEQQPLLNGGEDLSSSPRPFVAAVE